MDAEMLATLHANLTRIGRRLNAHQVPTSLTETDLFVLSFVDNRGPLTVKDLIAWEGLSPSMASRIVQRLTDAELITRWEEDHDRRVAWLKATPKGRRVHLKNRSQRAKVLLAALGDMDPAMVASLRAALPAIETLAQQLRRRPRAG